MLRVVADTNILVSSLLFGGVPAEVVSAATNKRILLITSEEIFAELDRVLQEKFKYSATDAFDMQASLRVVTQIVTPLIPVSAVEADADDNKIIECAVAGNADCIVSGDRHLKELKIWQGIEIITPREFVRRYL